MKEISKADLKSSENRERKRYDLRKHKLVGKLEVDGFSRRRAIKNRALKFAAI